MRPCSMPRRNAARTGDSSYGSWARILGAPRPRQMYPRQQKSRPDQSLSTLVGSLLAGQRDILVRPRIGIPWDQPKAGLGHAGTDSVDEGLLP
jgi:hypothetical protein